MTHHVSKNEIVQDECGVTRVSLSNFKLIKSKHGIPSIVSTNYTDEIGYHVYMEWDNGFSWTFKGLSWGYGGEGCRGFKEVLSECGFDCDINYIASLKKTGMIWDFS